MRKRNIQKIVRLSRDEAQDLQKKAKKACLSEAGLIRLLLRGYEPREKPDERFYDVMRELSAIGTTSISLPQKQTRSALQTQRSLKKKRSVGISFRQMLNEFFSDPMRAI